MDSRKNYHESVLERYMNGLAENVRPDAEIVGADGIILNSTEVISKSKIGIVIVPGITVPRESYYRLLAGFFPFNVLIFDLRGQAFSGGELSLDGTVKDINVAGQQFKKKRGLAFLIGIGHSFGGLALLRSSLEKDHPYDLRISLATPVDMTRISGKIPERASVFLVYIHNIFRALKTPALRDGIVRQYQYIWLPSFLKAPRIVALRINDPRSFNDTRLSTPKLTDFIKDVASPSHLIYAGNDTRLGIRGNLAGDYEELSVLASEKGFELTTFEGLSHRFNRGKETQFVLSYNNDKVIEKIREIIKHHISSEREAC